MFITRHWKSHATSSTSLSLTLSASLGETMDSCKPDCCATTAWQVIAQDDGYAALGAHNGHLMTLGRASRSTPWAGLTKKYWSPYSFGMWRWRHIIFAPLFHCSSSLNVITMHNDLFWGAMNIHQVLLILAIAVVVLAATVNAHGAASRKVCSTLAWPL